MIHSYYLTALLILGLLWAAREFWFAERINSLRTAIWNRDRLIENACGYLDDLENGFSYQPVNRVQGYWSNERNEH